MKKKRKGGANLRSETVENRKNERDPVLARAKVLLGESGNRLSLIIGILVCILATVAVLLVVSCFGLTVDFDAIYARSHTLGAVVDMAFLLVQMILLLFLVLPLYVGLFASALAMRNREKFELSDLFRFFGSPGAYRRGFGIVIFWVGRAFPYWILYGLAMVANAFESDLFYGLVGLLALPLILWGVYTTGRSFPFVVLALSDETVPLRVAMRSAKRMTNKKVWSLFVFRMRLFGKFCLSLFSVGVVTLLHVLPLTILANHEYAFFLADSSREHNN